MFALSNNDLSDITSEAPLPWVRPAPVPGVRMSCTRPGSDHLTGSVLRSMQRYEQNIKIYVISPQKETSMLNEALKCLFLAPTGAQEMQISVCSFVCLFVQ